MVHTLLAEILEEIKNFTIMHFRKPNSIILSPNIKKKLYNEIMTWTWEHISSKDELKEVYGIKIAWQYKFGGKLVTKPIPLLNDICDKCGQIIELVPIGKGRHQLIREDCGCHNESP